MSDSVADLDVRTFDEQVRDHPTLETGVAAMVTATLDALRA